MNILTRVRTIELAVKYYNLDKHVFEIFQTLTTKKPRFKSSGPRCISRGPYQFEELLLLIQNDIIRLGEQELECVLFQLEETLNQYIKEV